MTIPMPDSIRPASLPPGYRAYLGYADGEWPTAPVLRGLHPSAQVVGLTVTGGTLDADGVDCEPGNPDAKSAASWVKRKLDAEPGSRPVAYADLESRGYSMTEVLAELAKLGVSREQVRVHTAHYDGEHICSPARGCRDADGRVITFTADATQWTDQFAGVNGAKIDMSALADSYLGTPGPAPAPTSWEDELVANIPVLRQGDTGQAVKNWQALLLANGYSLAPDGEDGDFGPLTDERTRKFQEDKRIGVDGIVGPQTYGAMLSA